MEGGQGKDGKLLSHLEWPKVNWTVSELCISFPLPCVLLSPVATIATEYADEEYQAQTTNWTCNHQNKEHCMHERDARLQVQIAHASIITVKNPQSCRGKQLLTLYHWAMQMEQLKYM